MRQVTAGTRSFGFFETYFGECTVNINGTLLVRQTRVNGELDRQMDRHRKKEREKMEKGQSFRYNLWLKVALPHNRPVTRGITRRRGGSRL